MRPYQIPPAIAVIASMYITGCLPYLTQNRDEALVDKLDVDQTLVVAQRELEKGGIGSQLTIWAIRDQRLTPEQAQRVMVLYFRYIDRLETKFDRWHLTWAISNIYRLGDDQVKAAIKPAYDDATERAKHIHKAADKLANGERIMMGDAHGGGRAYAKSHLVAPGNERYLQSVEDYEWLKGRSKTHDPHWGPQDARDFTPEGWVKQPSFVSHGGMLNKNERAFVLTVDGELLPPAIIASYRYGLFYWWEAGLDVGGNGGVFEALLHTKMENYKSPKTEKFFWGTTYKTGFKHHKVDWGDGLRFDDRSWVWSFENTFARRFGEGRRKALFLVTHFYIDVDLHDPKRQTDYYIGPALVGFERVIGDYGNFFIQGGMVYSINGMEMPNGEILYNKDWFPVLQFGFGVRTGDRTAVYYGGPTRHMAKRK